MVIINNGLKVDIRAIKPILLKIYESKPKFPIKDSETLSTALGGKNQLLFINETDGELPSTIVAKKIFSNTDQIDEPLQIIDNLINGSFIKIITKVKLLDVLEKLKYPIESKDDFYKKTKDLGIFSIPIEIISDKIDYPIEKLDQIINRLKLMEKDLLDANVELIMNIIESKDDSNILEIDEKILKPDSEQDIQITDDAKEIRKKIKLLIEEGKNSYREKKYEDALRIYEMGLKLDSEDTELRFLKHSVQQKIADLEKSTEKLAKPVEPETPSESESQTKDNIDLTSSDTKLDQKSEQNLEIENIPEKNDNKDEERNISNQSSTASQISNIKLDDKIEELGKRLQERVSRLKNLSTPDNNLQNDACSSCEGKGECYWCKNTGKCSKCSGSGKLEDGTDCETCKGSGVCHSCNGSGKCHWCNGSGIRKEK